MLTREDVLKDYDVDSSGMITSLGKFQGELLFAPYFYQRIMDVSSEPLGMDAGGTTSDLVVVTAEDRREFPELNFSTTNCC